MRRGRRGGGRGEKKKRRDGKGETWQRRDETVGKRRRIDGREVRAMWAERDKSKAEDGGMGCVDRRWSGEDRRGRAV